MVCLRPSPSLAHWARRQGRRRGSGAGNRAATVTGPDTACLAPLPNEVPSRRCCIRLTLQLRREERGTGRLRSWHRREHTGGRCAALSAPCRRAACSVQLAGGRGRRCLAWAIGANIPPCSLRGGNGGSSSISAAPCWLRGRPAVHCWQKRPTMMVMAKLLCA